LGVGVPLRVLLLVRGLLRLLLLVLHVVGSIGRGAAH